MPIKSEYEKRIEAYIENNTDSTTNQVLRIEIEGRVRNLPVYRLPIKYLTFNIENGRFAADLISLRGDLGRALDPWKPSDQDKIKRILLDKYPHETKRFREDLIRVGQSDPGVITAAGVVINGNRRMAILSELFEKTSQAKYSYLEAAILPHNLSDIEICKIEAQLQYRKKFEMGYGPVNELLKMKDLLKKGMQKRELGKLLSRDDKYIDEHMAQLLLLEAYSTHTWKKIDYKKIEEVGITEIITDVEKNQRKFKDEGLKASEINKLLEVQFEYIKTGCSYRDIRDFGKVASVGGAERPYFEALSALKNKKISEESFKEMVDDANERTRIIKKDQKQIELAMRALEMIKTFQDKQFKITPEIKEYFVEISNIITKLLKGRR